MTKFDIVVVGAGPGGAMAARHAALKGASVLLVERRREIGVPVVCGELTSGGTMGEFSLPGDGPWIARTMDKARMVFPGDKYLDFHGIAFTMLHRDVFEKHLVKMATDEGVELRMNTCAVGVNRDGVVLKNGRVVKCGIVIGADGVKSAIGKSIGMTKLLPRSDLGRAVKYIVESNYVDNTACQFFLGEEGIKGYAWILPKGENTANVGVGLLGETRMNPGPLLDRFIEKRLPGAVKKNYAAGCLPLAVPPERTVWENVMLVGDAASMVNSVGGAGIRNAMVAGKLAGEIAGTCVTEGRDLSYLKTYENAWRRKIYLRLRVNHLVKCMMWHSDLSVRSLYPITAPLNRISNMVSGLITYLQFRQHK